MDLTLSDGRVRLRPFRIEDSFQLHAAACESNGALQAAMTWFWPTYSLDDAANFINRSPSDWANGERYDFAILDASQETFLGSVGLSRIEPRHKLANVGYWVRRSSMGRGIATAAVRLICDFGINELGLLRLEFMIAKSNLASQRVVAKVGANYEGTLRKRFTLANAPEDALMFSLIRDDWEKMRGENLSPS